jgi:hypothetical protein
MQIPRIALAAISAVALNGCHAISFPRHSARAAKPAATDDAPRPSGLTNQQLAEIFADRRAKGAMVSVRAVNATEYAIDFATPDPPITGTNYRYETFTIQKTKLEKSLAAEIGRVAMHTANPGG